MGKYGIVLLINQNDIWTDSTLVEGGKELPHHQEQV